MERPGHQKSEIAFFDFLESRVDAAVVVDALEEEPAEAQAPDRHKAGQNNLAHCDAAAGEEKTQGERGEKSEAAGDVVELFRLLVPEKSARVDEDEPLDEEAISRQVIHDKVALFN